MDFLDVRTLIDEQEMAATAAAHGAALIRKTPAERRPANIGFAAGKSPFELHVIESNRRKGGILRDR